jgi:hypothetical protein
LGEESVTNRDASSATKDVAPAAAADQDPRPPSGFAREADLGVAGRGDDRGHRSAAPAPITATRRGRTAMP